MCCSTFFCTSGAQLLSAFPSVTLFYCVLSEDAIRNWEKCGEVLTKDWNPRDYLSFLCFLRETVILKKPANAYVYTRHRGEAVQYGVNPHTKPQFRYFKG